MEEVVANKGEITTAIAAHGKWKQRLIDAIETGKSEFTAQRLKVDNLCDFGKWLYSLSLEEKKSPHWNEIQKLHAKFHIEAAKILELALTGKVNEAKEAMSLSKDYVKLSGELTRAMMKWRDSII